MCSPISLGPDLRRMTYHQPAVARRMAGRGFVRYGASVSIFAITLGASGSLNAPHGFSQARADSSDGVFPFSDMAPMSDTALDNARGGFSVGNVNVSVGVTVETQIDGFITVTTNFNLSMPGMMENMGTEIRSVAEAATEAANAAIEAANTATEAAATAWQNPPAAPDGAAPAPTAPTNIPTNIEVGEITTAVPQVNGSAAIPPAIPVPPLVDNPTVAQALETLNQGIRTVLGDSLTEYEPPAETAVAVAAPPPILSIVASKENSTHNNGAGSVSVSSLVKEGTSLVVPGIPAHTAQVIHDTTNGHTTVISNRMNNVTIRQNVSMNMTVDNFTSLQNTSSLNRAVSSLSRQISLMGLRR